jgi:hypothetical protein
MQIWEAQKQNQWIRIPSTGKGIDLSFPGRLGAAKREAGNSMIKYQQIVYPLCIDIQVCFYFLRSVVDL